MIYYKDSHYPYIFIDDLRDLCKIHGVEFGDLYLRSYRGGEIRFNLAGGVEGYDHRQIQEGLAAKFGILNPIVDPNGLVHSAVNLSTRGAKIICVREDAVLWGLPSGDRLWVAGAPPVGNSPEVWFFFGSWGQLYVPAKFVSGERPGLLAFGPEGPSYAFLNERMAIKGYFPEDAIETTPEGWDCISLANVAKSENPAIRAWLRDLGLA